MEETTFVNQAYYGSSCLRRHEGTPKARRGTPPDGKQFVSSSKKGPLRERGSIIKFYVLLTR